MDFINIVVGDIVICLFIAGFCFIILYQIRQNKSVIDRARKIDPSVKTITEAHYVLEKDIVKNFGNSKNNDD